MALSYTRIWRKQHLLTVTYTALRQQPKNIKNTKNYLEVNIDLQQNTKYICVHFFPLDINEFNKYIKWFLV